ncbi:MAG TPA: DUF1080 domain-containing protein [Isosphaeraceae bacterium]|jgi:hypothetical protein
MLSCGPAGGVAAPVLLFNGKDLSGWSIFIDPSAAGYRPDSDPGRVFRVEDGLIRVSGERFGYLQTRESYRDYRLRFEFKWGRDKWPPRADAARDSGVLVHCVGPDKIWPRSIECQIQEHDCGDFWMVDGASLEVGGQVRAGGRAIKTADAEKPSGEWNRVEVVCRGDTITNIINGVVVNEGRRASVSKGRILLQSEGAEIFFRAVELLPLTETSPSRG